MTARHSRRPRQVEGGPRIYQDGSSSPSGCRLGRSSGRLRLADVADPHQVVPRGGQGKQPPDPPHPAVAGRAQERHRLDPPEDLLDALALLLTHRVSRMAGGPGIDRTGLPRRVLPDMRGETERAEGGDEAPGVIALVRSVAPRRRFVAMATAVSRSAMPVA